MTTGNASVFLVRATWCDGYEALDWVEGLYSSEEKAMIAVEKLKAQDEENREYNHMYEIQEWWVE